MKFKPFDLLAIAFFMGFVRCDVKVINLNDIVDANLAYFEASIPINSKLDGKLLFDQVLTESADYYDIRLMKIGSIGRKDNVKQTIDLDGDMNMVDGSIYVRQATMRIGRMELEDGRTFSDLNVEIFTPALETSFFMVPSIESCSLSMTLKLTIDEAVVVTGDGRSNDDITATFQNSFIRYINKHLKNVRIATIGGGCKNVSAYDTVKQSLEKISKYSIGELMEKDMNRKKFITAL